MQHQKKTRPPAGFAPLVAAAATLLLLTCAAGVHAAPFGQPFVTPAPPPGGPVPAAVPLRTGALFARALLQTPPAVTVEPSIVGGVNAPSTRFKYQLGLYALWQDGTGALSLTLCGGTLIREDVMLTAAHCVVRAGYTLLLTKPGYYPTAVYAGYYSDYATDISSGKGMTVRAFVAHPAYNPTTIANDVAVVLLNNNVVLSDTVRVAVMATSAEVTAAADYMWMMTGWGTTSQNADANGMNGARPAVLQVGIAKYDKNNACAPSYPWFDPNSMICAGSQPADPTALQTPPYQSTCPGDSGGPLIFNKKQSSDPVNSGSFLDDRIAGVTSWIPGNCGLHAYWPPGFNKLVNFRTWVQTTIQSYASTAPAVTYGQCRMYSAAGSLLSTDTSTTFTGCASCQAKCAAVTGCTYYWIVADETRVDQCYQDPQACCGTGATKPDCPAIPTATQGNPFCPVSYPLNCGLLCNAQGNIVADPHFTGFDGTRFLFNGYDDAIFALISEREHQVNAAFGNINPQHVGWNSSTWMTGFGIRYRDVLTLSTRLDIDAPHQVVLTQELEADGTPKRFKRANLPNEDVFLHIEVNGVHADELLYSGKAVEGLPDGVVVYFPPKTAVHKGDARDGPVIVVKTPLMEFTIAKETEDEIHLDLNVKLLGEVDDMHGVLGQTLSWTPADVSRLVTKGVYVGDDSEFEVQDGLLGWLFKDSRFRAGGAERALPATVASMRRALAAHAPRRRPGGSVLGLTASAHYHAQLGVDD